jgi:hypothetical protein
MDWIAKQELGVVTTRRPKYAVYERNKGFKHLKVFKSDAFAMPTEDFVPLDTVALPVKSTHVEQELEESWEDEILRRTREFNKMTRERPQMKTFGWPLLNFRPGHFHTCVCKIVVKCCLKLPLRCIIFSCHLLRITYNFICDQKLEI